MPAQTASRRRALRVRIEHKEVNVVVLAFGLRDVFAMLADEKFVQLEILADDGFADGTHISRAVEGRGSRAWCDEFVRHLAAEHDLADFLASTNLISPPLTFLSSFIAAKSFLRCAVFSLTSVGRPARLNRGVDAFDSRIGRPSELRRVSPQPPGRWRSPRRGDICRSAKSLRARGRWCGRNSESRAARSRFRPGPRLRL